jgi:hypothetical protein
MTGSSEVAPWLVPDPRAYVMSEESAPVPPGAPRGEGRGRMPEDPGDEMQDDVQASGGDTERPNRHLQRSHSEQARYLSAYFGWSLHGDAIRADGTLVSMFVEDLADTMVALGWLDGSGIHWERVPVESASAVAAVRDHQADQGWVTPDSV